jgi:hypothetical protein
MHGSKKRVANESPPEGPYIIRTGFYFVDERTGKRFGVLTCSDDQNGGSWLEEESTIENRRLTCRRGEIPGRNEETHEKTHPVISFREAVEWGVLDVAEGCVLIANDDLLRTLARRIA